MAGTPNSFRNRDHDAPDDRVHEILVRYFDDAATRIQQAIITPEGKSASSQEWNQARASAIGAQVRKIQQELASTAAKWTGNGLSKAFRQGTQTADAQARQAGIRQVPELKGSFHVVDRKAVEALARDTAADLIKAADGMAATAQDTLRRMAATGVTNSEVNKILAGGVIEGKPVQAIRELREQLKRVHGKTVTITTPAGTFHYKAGYYAKMVAVTKTREAVCKARHARLADLGLDLVTVVGKISDNFCTAYLDKVFSISGKHPKYPPLSTLPGGGPPFHPNCSKSTAPFVEEFATAEEIDAADPKDPSLGLMTQTLNTTTLQRVYKDRQLRRETEARHSDVVESITGEKPARIPRRRFRDDTQPSETITAAERRRAQDARQRAARTRTTPAPSPAARGQARGATALSPLQARTQQLRSQLTATRQRNAELKAQLEAKRQQLQQQIADLQRQLAVLKVGDVRIKLLKSQIAALERMTRLLDRANDRGNA